MRNFGESNVKEEPIRDFVTEVQIVEAVFVASYVKSAQRSSTGIRLLKSAVGDKYSV
jgi:hypothetical protein